VRYKPAGNDVSESRRFSNIANPNRAMTGEDYNTENVARVVVRSRVRELVKAL
jgi:hypothetical protein